MHALQLKMMIIPIGAIIFPNEVSRDKNQIIHSSYWDQIENARAVYLIQSKKSLEHYKFDKQLPVFGGRTTEDLFVIEDAIDVVDFVHGWKVCHEWMAEYMNESANADFEHAVDAIYADVRKEIGLIPEEEWAKEKPEDRYAYPITMLTDWTIYSSTEWETGHSDIDSIEYDGPAFPRTQQTLPTIP